MELIILLFFQRKNDLPLVQRRNYITRIPNVSTLHNCASGQRFIGLDNSSPYAIASFVFQRNAKPETAESCLHTAIPALTPSLTKYYLTIEYVTHTPHVGN